MTNSVFRVGVGRDLRGPDDKPVHDIGLDLIDAADGVTWEFLPAAPDVLDPATIAGFDAVVHWESGTVNAATLTGGDRLRVIAKCGMGLDAIDVAACSQKGVLVTQAPDAVRSAVPTGALAFVLALAHRLSEKDRLVRGGDWNERFDYVALGTQGRTLGVIGMGNVGSNVLRMAEPFGFRRLAYDPYASAQATPEGVQRADLDTLLREADFVCVTCPLTDATRGLIGSQAIARMKASAYVVNVARGPIVDNLALAEAIAAGRLAGAGLDVFETEPIADDHPLLALGNAVLLTPHAIAYTHAAIRGNGSTACRAVLSVAAGAVPAHLANPEALATPPERSQPASSPRST